MSEMPPDSVLVSVVMPCLNEANTVSVCIRKARACLASNGIAHEIIIADNGSVDGSPELARAEGARVIHVSARGYGNALMEAIAAARGAYIIMGDSDDSYDFSSLMPFVDELDAGHDLVMGNRFLGGIEPGAMPLLHRYLGNPVLSALGRLFFRTAVHDFHCGLRGFTKEAATRMLLQCPGMEFASEMVVKASLLGMKITEVPTILRPDGRGRPSHLRTWRDGWRHLRFLLCYSPAWLFLYPGAFLAFIGIALMGWLLPGARRVGPISLDVHTLVFALTFVLVGFSAVSFFFLTRVYAFQSGLMPLTAVYHRLFRILTLERGLAAGLILALSGLAGAAFSVFLWSQQDFGPLDPVQSLRVVIPSALALVLGSHVVLISFFFSIMGMPRR